MDPVPERLVYRKIPALTTKEVDDSLSRDDPDELRFVAISASMFSDDFDSAQEICLLLANHSNGNVRGNAVQSFGHLARRFRKLDLLIVAPLYRSALRDPDGYVRSQAQDTLGEIRYYLNLPEEWPG